MELLVEGDGLRGANRLYQVLGRREVGLWLLL